MRVVISWSSGKDSAWALYALRREGVEIVGLLTTLNEEADRVAMHGVRRVLVEAQAEAAGLPLQTVYLPWPCSNAVYESRMREAFAAVRAEGATHVAFGDLFLEEVRAYRERQLAGSDLDPLFPLWHPQGGTDGLAGAMLDAGLDAIITCVDTAQIPSALAGRKVDRSLLADLPDGADACGERGEYHTFCCGGPMFEQPIRVRAGVTVVRDGFCYTDVFPLGSK